MDTCYSKRLEALRQILKQEGLEGYFQPYGDAYQNHFLPPSEERLAWLSGFTGSAGFAVVLMESAVVMSDGRYRVQLKKQIDSALYETGDFTKVSAGKWLAERAKSGAKIGYDPDLLTIAQIEKIEAALEGCSISLQPMEKNPVDLLWGADRPERQTAPVRIFPEKIAGLDISQKISKVSEVLLKKQKNEPLEAFILTSPASLSWLLNVRSSEVKYLPVVLSRAILYADGTLDWFVEPARVTAEIKDHIGPGVRVCAPEEMEAVLKAQAGPVGVDFENAPIRFKNILTDSGTKIQNIKDPCVSLKACKTPAEIEGIKEAHIRDGAALATFLHWVSEQAGSGICEGDIAEKSTQVRAVSNSYQGPSFPPIIGFGENGAIIHYTLAAGEKGAPVKPPGLLLMDTGGQYVDGTTDITRTVAIGEPTEEMRRHFTLVLKGHINLALARFPEGATGAQLDILARRALWEEGLDYAHGTGHGVGTNLDVHEESATISPRGQRAFEAGMVITNEPGYYREGQYGIRIENVMTVEEAGPCSDTPQKMMRFKTLSLAPIDRNLIERALLTEEELEWLNAYHAEVYAKISPHLEEGVRRWLRAATAPL
ncbi:MAG: aminopeptidase P family protein [Rhodospirillales bacterium]|nr:aminopeptidase P family protein [Alphaproteobacteria bacterium]USO02908.1 MAG: aminopeptidase P family protein [Rhodospirillales bacterium]